MEKQINDVDNFIRELVIKCTEDFIIQDVSYNVSKVLGVSKEEIVNTDIRKIFVNEKESATLFYQDYSINLQIKINNRSYIMNCKKYIKNINGSKYIYISMVNISEYKDVHSEMYGLKRVVESSKDVIYFFQVYPEFKFKYLSPSIDEFLGKGLLKKSYEDVQVAFDTIHPDDYQVLMDKINGKVDYNKPILQRWKNDKGEYVWFDDLATPIIENEKIIGIQGVMRSIDANKKRYYELEYRVNHDTLTGLYSREYFENLVEKYDKQENASVGLIMCDIDKLKYVNDNYGHRNGDVLIKRTADILNKYSSQSTFVSRIGGDEFALMVVGATEDKVSEIVRNIDEDIKKVNNETYRIEINLSKGFVFEKNSLGNMQILLFMADAKLYEKKMDYV